MDICNKLLLSVIVVILCIVIYNNNCKQNKDEKQIIVNVQNPTSNVPVMQPPLFPPRDPKIEFDQQTFRNPLLPPRRRDDWNVPLPTISTRGYPSPYHKMGTLVNPTAENNDKFKFLFLIGRQKYPGSNFYDYFVTDANNEKASLKFDLDTNHKELSTGDTVNISQLGSSYNVTMDKFVDLEYNPYVF